METVKNLKGCGDLHLHSRFSDGSLDVENIMFLAAKVGLGYISITDHDYFNDLNYFKKLEDEYKIKIIFGAELSCMDFKRNRKVHILCYNIKTTDLLKPFCEESLKTRRDSAKKVLNSLSEQYNIIPELIEKSKSKNGCIFETNFLRIFAECGYSNKVCGDFYNVVFKGENKINFIHHDVRKILKLIRESGGKSVLAHPRVHDSFDLLNELVLEKLLDGVEVWHPKNNDEDRKYLYDIAAKNDLIATGGTDFHGLYNSSVVRIGDCFTPNLYINRILN